MERLLDVASAPVDPERSCCFLLAEVLELLSLSREELGSFDVEDVVLLVDVPAEVVFGLSVVPVVLLLRLVFVLTELGAVVPPAIVAKRSSLLFTLFRVELFLAAGLALPAVTAPSLFPLSALALVAAGRTDFFMLRPPPPHSLDLDRLHLSPFGVAPPLPRHRARVRAC